MKTTETMVLFWRGRDVFSNFYRKPFLHKGIKFNWSEQAVMYRKAMFFGAKDVAEEILEADNSMDCKQLGRSRRIPFKEEIWEQERELIYKEVLVDKFSIPELKKEILSTEDKILVEASPFDYIWGVGLGEDDPRILEPKQWKGLNLLGKVLMEVREHLRKEDIK